MSSFTEKAGRSRSAIQTAFAALVTACCLASGLWRPSQLCFALQRRRGTKLGACKHTTLSREACGTLAAGGACARCVATLP